jgi:hypothetical protein
MGSITAVGLLLLNDDQIYLYYDVKRPGNRNKFYLFDQFVWYDSLFFRISSQSTMHIERAITGLIPQSLRPQARSMLADLTRLESVRNPVRVDQCVSAVRAVELPVLVCLRSSCYHVTGRRPVSFVTPALKGVMQNDGEFVDVILLYTKT